MTDYHDYHIVKFWMLTIRHQGFLWRNTNHHSCLLLYKRRLHVTGGKPWESHNFSSTYWLIRLDYNILCKAIITLTRFHFIIPKRCYFTSCSRSPIRELDKNPLYFHIVSFYVWPKHSGAITVRSYHSSIKAYLPSVLCEFFHQWENIHSLGAIIISQNMTKKWSVI